MSVPEPEGGWPQTQAELARRHGVHKSAITRALAAAQARHDTNPDEHPPPPAPVNPGEERPRWLPAVFDPWWENRPRRGRPKGT
ncbi:hypothetical protein Q8791_23360 [Nocardiopsis sp. CT-R113]|uniref:Uncharacterized protein n=1 Tax=Nocardiopsis codii TaxID=3065942 RepID=A0ABU7KD48_9ACTN|nr:hypothetical protein [Nocardiopsis sp. CT-R113]MEE2040159.1 hypothetical protein [Nocardiopsis sp. CT-R113]